MKYTVTVKVVNPTAANSYDRSETIYEQTVESLDVQAVIAAVNPPAFPISGDMKEQLRKQAEAGQ